MAINNIIILIASRLSRPIIRAEGVNCRNINMHAYKRPEPIKPQDNQRGLEIIFRSRAELKPDPANPRRHSKKQIKQIAKSIRVFGFNVPVLVDRDSNVIAGHGRLLACGELGIDEVPTSCLEHLTPAQARAFRIADNKLTENATWDDRLLAEQLRDLSLSGLDFDIEVTGFEMGEIDLRIASLEDTPAPGSDPIDILPEVSVAPLVSKFGDLWLLGRHRVLCGNALEPEAFTALMGAERAAMVFTDPPYNVPIEGHAGGLGTIYHRPFPMASGEMDRAEFTAFLRQTCCNLAAFSTAGSLHYVCMDWRHLAELLAIGQEAYGELKNMCVWVKDNAGMGSLYRSQHEFVLVFKQRGGPHRNRSYWGCSATSEAKAILIPPIRLSPRPTSRSSPASKRGWEARRNDQRPFASRIRRDPALGSRLVRRALFL